MSPRGPDGKPRRVDLVSEHASPLATLGGVDAGGQNVHVAELAKHLAALGHRVVVHTRRDDPHLPDRVMLAPNVLVHHVDAGPPRAIPKDELFPYMDEFAAGLAAAWGVDRPEVAHSHFWMSGWAATTAGAVVGVPILHTFHALGTVKRRHQGVDDTSPAERLPVETSLLARCERIIATCRDERTELTAMGGTPQRVVVIPCGVDVSKFTPALAPRAQRPSGRIDVLAISRLVPRKGLAELIHAVAATPGCHLRIIGGPDRRALGTTPEALRLLALAADVGAADRVTLLGRRDRTEIPMHIRSADVVACVPQYEPFGIVPLEAMACGVPVVGTAVGGLRDSVVHGRTGLLVQPGDVGAIRSALVTLRDDPGMRHAMGAAGVGRARRCFSWASVATRTAATYASVLQAELAASS